MIWAFVCLWLVSGVVSAIWFYRHAASRVAAYRHPRRWQVWVDYGIAFLSGPLGLLINVIIRRRRDA